MPALLWVAYLRNLTWFCWTIAICNTNSSTSTAPDAFVWIDFRRHNNFLRFFLPSNVNERLSTLHREYHFPGGP